MNKLMSYVLQVVSSCCTIPNSNLHQKVEIVLTEYIWIWWVCAKWKEISLHSRAWQTEVLRKELLKPSVWKLPDEITEQNHPKHITEYRLYEASRPNKNHRAKSFSLYVVHFYFQYTCTSMRTPTQGWRAPAQVSPSTCPWWFGQEPNKGRALIC